MGVIHMTIEKNRKGKPKYADHPHPLFPKKLAMDIKITIGGTAMRAIVGH